MAAASEMLLELIGEHADKVAGVKMSLLDAAPRSRCAAPSPRACGMFTGDDFNYPGLIDGDGNHHSDALLGAFAAVAPAASRHWPRSTTATRRPTTR